MTLIIPLAIADEAPSPSLSLTCVFHHSALCLTDSLALSPASELFSTTKLLITLFKYYHRAFYCLFILWMLSDITIRYYLH